MKTSHLFLLLAAAAFSSLQAGEIKKGTFPDGAPDAIPYQLFIPDNPDNKPLPLVVCFHGAAGRGNDNAARGIHAFEVLASPEVQKAHPAYLLAPQCPKSDKWVNVTWSDGGFSLKDTPISKSLETALDLARSVAATNRVDPDRIYVTGQSMGGYATWYSILSNPDFFAAAVPVCGGGDPSVAERIKGVAVWTFHGANDNVVPPKGSRNMFDRLKAIGAPVKYTEFPGVGHTSMTNAWAEPGLIPWLFEQKKSSGATVPKP